MNQNQKILMTLLNENNTQPPYVFLKECFDALPKYKYDMMTSEVQTQDDQKQFESISFLNFNEIARGVGKSKKMSKIDCAKKSLQRLLHENSDVIEYFRKKLKRKNNHKKIILNKQEINQRDSDFQEDDIKLNSDEMILQCSKCNRIVNQILGLKCLHNLCLDCAGHVIKVWSPVHNNSNIAYRIFQCEKCVVTTEIKFEIIQNILDYVNGNPLNQLNQEIKSENCYQSQNDNHLNQFQQKPPLPISSPESFSFSQQNKDYKNQLQVNHNGDNQWYQDAGLNIGPYQTIKKFCELHKNEPTYLFCINCQSKCFCPQCVNLWNHQSHDIRSVSVQPNDFSRTLVQNLEQQMKNSDNELTDLKSRFKLKKLELIDIVTYIKFQIEQNFIVIKQLLAEKEKELISKATFIYQKNTQTYDKELLKLENKGSQMAVNLSGLNTLLKNINSIDINQKIETLNLYSEVKRKHEESQLEINNMKPHLEHLLQIKNILDLTSIEKLVNEIKLLNLIYQQDSQYKENIHDILLKDPRLK